MNQNLLEYSLNRIVISPGQDDGLILENDEIELHLINGSVVYLNGKIYSEYLRMVDETYLIWGYSGRL